VVTDTSVNAGGTMDVSAIGHIAVTSTGAAASQLSSTGLQTINATKSLYVQGGDSGSSKFGQITSDGGQTVAADAIIVAAGADGGGFGTGNSAQIANQSTVAAQTVTVGAGGLTLRAGGGKMTDNFAG